MDFACKKFDLNEVIKCSFGLTKSEFNLFQFFISNSGNFTTEQLSKKLKLDKSTIQRSIKKLHQKKIVFRGQKNLSGGGYVFIYSLRNKENIRQMVLNTISNWVKVFEEEIKKW